jgi:hypothetical protein
MLTFSEIIDLWPSPRVLANDIEVKPGTLAVWKHRNRIPPTHWVALVKSAERHGIENITLDLLARLVAKRTPAADSMPSEAPHAAEGQDETACGVSGNNSTAAVV